MSENVILYTERATCASCRDIIMNFRADYLNIELEIITPEKPVYPLKLKRRKYNEKLGI